MLLHDLGSSLDIWRRNVHPIARAEFTFLAPVTSGGLGRQVSWVLRLMSVPGLGEFLFQHWLYDLLAINKLVFHDLVLIPHGVLTEIAGMQFFPGCTRSTRLSIRSTINLMGLQQQSKILHRLPQLSAPLARLWGQWDIIIPVIHAGWIKDAIPRSLASTFTQCGHWPHMEKAGEFNALLTQFLEGVLDDQSGSILGPVPL